MLNRKPKNQILALFTFTFTFTLGATLSLNCHASTEPLDIFKCTHAVFSPTLLKTAERPNKSAHHSYIMAGLPFDKTPQAFIVNIGKFWQRQDRHAGLAPGFAIVTPKGLSCHQLHEPKYDHGAGNLWENYPYVLDYTQPKIGFQVTVHRENESRKFLGSTVGKREYLPRHLKPHSCLNPENAEFKSLLHQLSRMTDLHRNALQTEARTRRDIREHAGDGPAPAFDPAVTSSLSPGAIRACRRFANQELRRALDQYERAVDDFLRSSEPRHSTRRHLR